MQQDILYLGSESRARQNLLKFAQINYQLLRHASDEKLEPNSTSLANYVLAIAKHKMQNLQLPATSTVDTDYIYVCTADTLVKNIMTNAILGKPLNREDAIRMLMIEHKTPLEVVTGCCLEKFQRHDNQWVRIDFVHWTNGAEVEFHVDADSIERYLTTFPFVLYCAGGAAIEDHGLAYLKSIKGSYTAVIGLPLYELRLELKKMGFMF